MGTARRCGSILLAGMLALIGMFFGGERYEKADALSPDYTGDSIYYFSNSEPLLSSLEMENAFGDDYSVFYDTQYYIDAQELEALVESGYFDGNVGYSVIIVELKTMLADALFLKTWFQSLKSGGCTVIFVSCFGLDDYYNTQFINFTDAFLHCKKDRFLRFIEYSVKDMVQNKNFGIYSCIMLDNRFLDTDWMNGDFASCLKNSIFLRVFLNELQQQLRENNNVMELLADGRIKLIIDFMENEFIDLFGWLNGQSDTIYDITGIPGPGDIGMDDLHHLYAFGIWQFMPEYYNLLKFIQDELKKLAKELPIYAWVVDPLNYDPNGLEIITDINLIDTFEGAGAGETEDDEDTFALLNQLQNILYSDED